MYIYYLNYLFYKIIIYILYIMNYYKQYIKYKIKYLRLKQNLEGGGLDSAKKYYISQLRKNYNFVRDILVNDRFLSNELPNLQTELPQQKPDNFDNPIFTDIFNKINEQVDKRCIDLLCKIYLAGALGIPNSIENKGRLVYSIDLFNKIPVDKRDGININDFQTLRSLENYITCKREILQEIENKKNKKKASSEKQKKLKEEGEDDVEILLDTPKVKVYHPTSEAGSKFYGRNTRWCTAAQTNCMFDHYNRQGPLFIIELQKRDAENFLIKYQIHFETNQIMDSRDNPVDINQLIKDIGDIDFTNWLTQMYVRYLNSPNAVVNSYFFDILEYLTDKSVINELKTLTFDIYFPLDFLSNISNFTNLQNLTLGCRFNKPLGDSLLRLTNLKNLTFKKDSMGYGFNQPLGDSLTNLINLQNLTFGSDLNQSLGDSLSNLTNLQNLTFGERFNQPLGNSLSNLTNLQNLTFGERFNQPLGNSLSNLTNLQNLTFGDFRGRFNQPLGDSLFSLINLQNLTFSGSFNQPLGNSLSNLTNLQNITFGSWFDQPLGNSLLRLTNLQNLTFGQHFNQALGNSLSNLTNLQNLTFGDNFNQRLGDSLYNLGSLKTITFGNNYEQEFGVSLRKLTNLETIKFNYLSSPMNVDQLEHIDNASYILPKDINFLIRDSRDRSRTNYIKYNRDS